MGLTFDRNCQQVYSDYLNCSARVKGGVDIIALFGVSVFILSSHLSLLLAKHSSQNSFIILARKSV